MLYKILVEDPSGIQKLQTVDETGSYFDTNLVTWDERVDGPFPSVQEKDVGGLVRAGNRLVVDAAKAAAYQAVKDAKASVDSIKAARRARLKAYDDDAATPAQSKQFRKDLKDLFVELLGL